MQNTSEKSTNGSVSQSRRWLFPLLLAVLAVVLVVRPGRNSAPVPANLDAPQAGVVTVTLDTGQANPASFSIPLQATVLEVLQALGQQHSEYRAEIQGQDDSALVLAIGRWRNEGAGRNWTYQVNGEMADRSAGVMPVESGDRVLWKFAAEE